MTSPAAASTANVGVSITNASGTFFINSDRQPAVRSPQSFEPETMRLPAGSCLLGQDLADGAPPEESPAHRIELPAFRIGRFPLTNREYQEFIQARPSQDAPEHWRARRAPQDRLDHPVTGVSWHDAMAYCGWLAEETGQRYRLPTEAEWEQTARSPDGRRYPWGDSWQDGHCNAAGDGATGVAAFPSGASAHGVEDLLGNAQEWTLTCWGADSTAPDYPYPYDRSDGRDDPKPPCAFRIFRGGCWRDAPEALRASARGWAAATSRVPWRGFRVLLMDS